MTFWMDIAAIILGVAAVDVTVMLVKYLWNRWRYHELNELTCDLCKEARKLVRTPDEKHFWLCSTCMGTYVNENGYSDLEKERILSSYTKRPKRRGKRKK
jgi:hypothetical protein